MHGGRRLPVLGAQVIGAREVAAFNRDRAARLDAQSGSSEQHLLLRATIFTVSHVHQSGHRAKYFHIDAAAHAPVGFEIRIGGIGAVDPDQQRLIESEAGFSADGQIMRAEMVELGKAFSSGEDNNNVQRSITVIKLLMNLSEYDLCNLEPI